jgi:CubicO group peptidase (beta-lactamase class C family)
MNRLVTPTVRLRRLTAIVVLAGCARTPPPLQDISLPESPAGRALSGWLAAYNAPNADENLQAFVARSYAASELAARPADIIARGHRLWRMNYGHFELLRVDSSSEFSIDAFMRHGLTSAIGKVYVEVDSQPPHGITGVYLVPFMRPPPDLAATARRGDAQLARDLRAYTRALGDAGVLSGVVALYRNGTPLVEQALGMARREPPLANDVETRFELASLSKLFTAVAIAQLVEQGRLRFETTLAEALPSYPNRETATRITIHHLLTHTSGLPDYYRNGKFRQFEASIRSLEDYWPTFAMDSLWGVPGRTFDYSNANYVVLGAIIERLSGMPFERYVERFVFEPAGMTDSCYCVVGAPRRAAPYSRYTSGFGPGRRPEPDQWIEVPAEARRPAAPAGAGIATARDIARFGVALLTHRLISDSTFSRMLEAHVSMEGDGHRGYGFEEYNWFGVRFFGHGGNFWGVMSQVDIYPETGHVVVILSNNDASGGEAVRNWTRRALAGIR